MAIIPNDVIRVQKYKKKKKDYTEWYGMKKGLMSYLGLPSFLPLKAHLQHGAAMIYRNDIPDPHVLETDHPNIFLCNTYQKNICKQYLPNKNIYVIGSIFPLYRQKQGIVQDTNANGTLFFPAHSTESIEAKDNIEKTLQILEELPDYLKPIKVSIYYKDMGRKLNQVYEAYGYETFTNGHRKDPRFIDSFYNTLKTVKYAIGTTLGSQTYYAVEMGIPYAVIGDSPTNINRGNKYFPDGIVDDKNRSTLGYARHVKARRIFYTESFKEKLKITTAQKDFVLNSIGYYDKEPKEKIRKIVLSSMF